MSILFAAILIVILLLPGFVFRFSYLSESEKKIDPKLSFLDEIFFYIVLSFIIQTPIYLLIDNFICDVDENKFYLLLINNEKVAINNSITSFEIGKFFLYTLLVSSVSFALGRIVRYFVLINNWDLKFQFLKIYSHWYDFFEGRILLNSNLPNRENVIPSLDILVENKDGNYLYSGLLKDYVLGENDSLECVYLTYVMRRNLADDDTPEISDEEIDKRYYYMPGDYFMIQGSQIVNINITFYQPEEGQ